VYGTREVAAHALAFPFVFLRPVLKRRGNMRLGEGGGGRTQDRPYRSQRKRLHCCAAMSSSEWPGVLTVGAGRRGTTRPAATIHGRSSSG
jgi:hypothetical protein